ncbi:TniQ family protein [Janibacter sp. UYMM211]|uniref:TniQ family protein n=1 Tax=Janibacter sp. UYMM211 TaxID=3156342 RepID=UPI003396488E
MTALPLRIDPAPAEAWHGYLTRTAALHGTDVATLADHITLRRAGRWPGYHGVILDRERTARCAQLLHLEPAQVDAMHLSSLHGRAFDLTGLDAARHGSLDATRQVSHQGWVFLAGGRYCPICLQRDGIWRLDWRIPWITTCAHHRVWLEHRCPSCHQTVGRYNALSATAPSRARTRIGTSYCDLPLGGGVCGADLCRAPARPAPAAAVDSTLTCALVIASDRGVVAGEVHTGLQTLRAWQAAIGISISLGRSHVQTTTRNHRWSSPPRDAAQLHALLRDAAPLTDAPTVEAAAQVLLGWCATAGITSPNRHTFARATRPAPALTAVTDAALAHVGRVHVRLERRRDLPSRLQVLTWTPSDVPQLVWPCALPQHRRASSRPDQLLLRAVVAMILVRMHDGTTWTRAGSVLGIPPHTARNWTRYCFSARFPGLREDLLDTADRLAGVLPGQPARGSWQERPDITVGYGTTCLAPAQAPTCRRQDTTSRWCPCSEQERR